MKRQAIWTVVALAGVAVSAETASAQPRPGIGAPSRPAFSPYLNLVRPGASVTQNYYGLVRPEVQARDALQNLQGATNLNQQAIGNLQSDLTELPGTGHQALFLNHGSYFLTGGATGTGTPFSGAGARQNFQLPARTPPGR